MTSASMVPLRAILEIGDATLEANPFARMYFSPLWWPDGRRHRQTQRDTDRPFTIEREPAGWIARNEQKRVVLVEDEPVHFHALTITLRRASAPLVRAYVGAKLGKVALIDAPWTLSDRAPRRLGVVDGALVELISEQSHADMRSFDIVRARIHYGKQRWVAIDTRCEVPLRWLVEAGVTAPVEAHQVAETVVDLDGNIRRIPMAPDELGRASWGYPELRRGFIHAGVVLGFFPDRVREWRELEEQVAAMPRDEGDDVGDDERDSRDHG